MRVAKARAAGLWELERGTGAEGGPGRSSPALCPPVHSAALSDSVPVRPASGVRSVTPEILPHP